MNTLPTHCVNEQWFPLFTPPLAPRTEHTAARASGLRTAPSHSSFNLLQGLGQCCCGGPLGVEKSRNWIYLTSQKGNLGSKGLPNRIKGGCLKGMLRSKNHAAGTTLPEACLMVVQLPLFSDFASVCQVPPQEESFILVHS